MNQYFLNKITSINHECWLWLFMTKHPVPWSK